MSMLGASTFISKPRYCLNLVCGSGWKKWNLSAFTRTSSYEAGSSLTNQKAAAFVAIFSGGARYVDVHGEQATHGSNSCLGLAMQTWPSDANFKSMPMPPSCNQQKPKGTPMITY